MVAYVCDLLDMAQAHFIREWRKHRKLTQEQLAAAVGIDKSYLSKIENGKKRYDQPFLESAARAMGCSPSDLLRRDPSAPLDPYDVWTDMTPVQRNQWLEIGKTISRTGTDN